MAARRVERTRLADHPRELEVFKLMAHGMSNVDIATRLGISERTVRVHITHLLVKLGCNDKTQAVFEAFQRGILHAGDNPEKAPAAPS